MADLQKVKQNVLWCLEHKPATRDCKDLFLILSVMKNFHREDFIDFLRKATEVLGEEAPGWMKFNRGNLDKLPSFESIRRARQKIQNSEGLFPPSLEAKAARLAEEYEYTEFVRK